MSGGIDRSAYLEAFRQEMEEHLQGLTEGLLSLEGRPDDPSLLGDVFRRAHTIKGSAQMMGFDEIAGLANSMEDLLEDLREGRVRGSAPVLDALLAAVDQLREMAKVSPEGPGDRSDVRAVSRWLGDLRGPAGEGVGPQTLRPQQAPEPVRGAHEPPPVRAAGVRRQDSTARETVRVGVERIDTILNLAGELTILDAARKQWSQEVARFVEMLQAIKVEARAGNLRAVEQQCDLLCETASRTGKRSHRFVSQESEIVQELHYQVSTLRMMAIHPIFSLLQRAARDVARDCQKEVEVVLEGGETEIDREVLERVRDPLLHLVRNAVDHGIEPLSVRLAAGKPPVGRLRISAYGQGEQAIIEVEDDGAGIDFRSVRDAAARRGMLTAVEAEALENAECARLLFLPGFTTRTSAGEVSGRGVGLDVVKSEVDALKGRMGLDTRAGRGTKVTLELPITLAFTHVLRIEVGSLTCAVTCSSIRGIVEVTAGAVRTLQGREAVAIGGRTVPLVWLHRVLGMETGSSTGATRWPAIVLGPPERPIAFAVDRVLGDENVVAKPLGPLLRRVPYLSGGIILGTGRVALLLSSLALFDAARQTGPLAGAESGSKPLRKAKWVLVVDDAAVTRELERDILEGAGYQVETAVDGRDALAKLKGREFALVVADVEMPSLNGFEMAAAIRADPDLTRLPIVIVSSRESDEDKRRGMQLGVQAYVGKGSFDQVSLLDTIEGLIG